MIIRLRACIAQIGFRRRREGRGESPVLHQPLVGKHAECAIALGRAELACFLSRREKSSGRFTLGYGKTTTSGTVSILCTARIAPSRKAERMEIIGSSGVHGVHGGGLPWPRPVRSLLWVDASPTAWALN